MTLGEMIKRAREDLRMSQQDLADLLLVDRKSVHNWETGRNRPGRAHLAALEQVLGPLDAEPEDLAALVRGAAVFSDAQKRALLTRLGEPPPVHHAPLPLLAEPC